MSTFFDESSLVFIPSGYKTSKAYSVKPTDGTGDLAFTRSNDTATRVASNGLIEKVRTNLALQSNTFSNAAWTNNNSTETSGQAGYDGTNNAWFLTASSTSNAYIQQSIVFTGVHNYSIYLKKGTSDFAVLTIEGINGGYSYFNLATGALGTAVGVTASIQSIGNGWYRCSIVAAAILIGNAVRVYATDADNSPNVTNGNNILIQAAQAETGDIATPYIATTTAAVSVGPVANVPRLDYLNSSCPRLLLEPQRTNLVTYSEQANQYIKIGATIGSNVLTSPDGFMSADSIIEDASTGGHVFYNFSLTTFTAAAHTASVFAKKGGRDFFVLSLYDGAGGHDAYFNLNTGTIGNVDAGVTATITNYGNGWYRCSVTATTAASTGGIAIYAASANGINSYAGTNGLAAGYFYGWQLELGAYATSYIPTLGAAVTRGADAASKTGISSLIGQTEGTLFMELNIIAGNPDYHSMLQVFGDANNRVAFGQNISSTNLFLYINASGVTTFLTTTTPAGSYKIALAYKSGNSVLFVNGVAAITTANTFTFATALSTIFVNNFSGNEIGIFKNAQALLFKTRLTNDQLAELTTI